MASNQASRFLEFATLQMAAEAFLLRQIDSGVLPTDRTVIIDRLVDGNTHSSTFTLKQAEQFTDLNTGYQVLAQYRNDPLLSDGSGFSATLVRDRRTEELTLSFRSTEAIDDAVRDSKATNRLEIKELGWAFGQIAEM